MRTIIRRAVKPETIYDKIVTIVVVGIAAVVIGWNMAAFFSRYTVGEFAVILVGINAVSLIIGYLLGRYLTSLEKA